MKNQLILNRIYNSDCLEGMRQIEENSIDAIVTDPPYGLEFMGAEWDHGVPGIPFWQEALRVAKPGAHMLAFGGDRTHHRLMVAIEDAGWEIRTCLYWVHSMGFPKSLDISKQLDKMAGVEREKQWMIYPKNERRGMGGVGSTRPWLEKAQAEGGRMISTDTPVTDAARQWNGWGTGLKPAVEIITMARKPLSEKTVVENVLKWGTGAINIDACRIGKDMISVHNAPNGTFAGGEQNRGSDTNSYRTHRGRYPATLIHDGSDEVVGLFPETGAANLRNPNGNGMYGGNALNKSITKDTTVRGFEDNGGSASRFFYTAKPDLSERSKHLSGKNTTPSKHPSEILKITNQWTSGEHYEDSGSAARFFYTAKSSPCDRNKHLTGKNKHPTVKPVDLLRYLCKLITPPNGTILDPFCGSGSTGVAAFEEGFNYVLIDKDPEFCATAKIRCAGKRLEDFC